jgi:hypothetical protein
MAIARDRRLALLATALVVAGCASKPRQLMPTPVIYQEPSALRLFEQPRPERGTSTGVDLLYITDRGPETDPESTLPYGQTRARSIAFGFATAAYTAAELCHFLGREPVDDSVPTPGAAPAFRGCAFGLLLLVRGDRETEIIESAPFRASCQSES